MQLTVRDAARLLGVTEPVLERWVRRGELPAQLVDDRYRFNRIELLEWAAQRKMPVSPEILEEPGLVSRALPPVSQAIRTGGIHRGLPAASREDLLRAMVDRLPAPAGFDREFLYRMVLAREHLGSTSLGNGVAIPHPREPIVLRVEQPAIAVFLPGTPVDFGEGPPVHSIFLLLSPSTRAHLHGLAALATVLRDPGVIAKLSARAPDAEILAAVEQVEAAAARARAEGVARRDGA
ncbi:MAG TPA: PTS sugar transporter subunit IIA [Anaeromyxobacteraceae bacterium]|nr:PTS sugar transporter subunit IIA [Anaeromyxobacteraceae bacterium]